MFFILIRLHFKLITQPVSSSNSRRRDAPARGEWRQRNQEQWQGQGKALEREAAENDTVPRGACQTMCPARELRDREVQNRLHHFEMLAGTERDRRPRGDPLRAVKEYSRPAAGKDSTNPTDLRSPDVLLKTVSYLIDDIAASPHLHPWTEVSSIYTSFPQLSSFTIVNLVCSRKS